MKFSKRDIQIILFTILSLLLLLAPLTLIANNYFYHSDLNSHFEVTVVETEEETQPITFDELTQLDSIARIDRQNQIVIVDNSTYEEITNSIQQLTSEELDITSALVIKEIAAQDINSILLEAILITVVASVVFSLLFLFLYYRKKVNNGYIISLYMFILFFFAILATSISSLGYISVLSRITQVGLVDIYTILISLIVVGIIILASTFELRNTPLSIEEIQQTISEYIEKNYILLLVIVVLTTIPLFFSLGPIFIFQALTTYVVLLLSIAYLYFGVNTKVLLHYLTKASDNKAKKEDEVPANNKELSTSMHNEEQSEDKKVLKTKRLKKKSTHRPKRKSRR